MPLTRILGLSVALWYITKAMEPFLAFLRRLDDLEVSYGEAKPRLAGVVPGKAEGQALGRFIDLIFYNFGRKLKPFKC